MNKKFQSSICILVRGGIPHSCALCEYKEYNRNLARRSECNMTPKWMKKKKKRRTNEMEMHSGQNGMAWLLSSRNGTRYDRRSKRRSRGRSQYIMCMQLFVWAWPFYLTSINDPEGANKFDWLLVCARTAIKIPNSPIVNCHCCAIQMNGNKTWHRHYLLSLFFYQEFYTFRVYARMLFH